MGFFSRLGRSINTTLGLLWGGGLASIGAFMLSIPVAAPFYAEEGALDAAGRFLAGLPLAAIGTMIGSRGAVHLYAVLDREPPEIFVRLSVGIWVAFFSMALVVITLLSVIQVIFNFTEAWPAIFVAPVSAVGAYFAGRYALFALFFPDKLDDPAEPPRNQPPAPVQPTPAQRAA